MKRNIIYMVGALLSSAILTFSCSEDDVPTYSSMSVDKNDLFIKIENHTAEINITEGNGNYKVEVADENIATAQINGNKVTFTAVKNGRTTATITDWARYSTVINIRVKEDFELELDKSELSLFKNIEGKNTELIYINSGNDGYKIKSNDNEEVVEATITEDLKIKVTSLSKGIANIIVTDNDGKEFPLKVTSYDDELKLGETPSAWKAGTDKAINIITGNGGYEISSDNTDIAEATIVYDDPENPEKCTIKITGKTVGETTITVTDEMGLSAPVKVNVKKPMSVLTTSIDELVIDGETQDIIIEDGSGKFECSADGGIECTLSEDGTKVTLKGTGKAYDRTVTLTDREFGDKKNITVKMIDEPFLEIQTKRYFIKGGFSTKEYGKIEKDGVRERVTVSSLGTTWPFKGKPVSGFRISFAGGREEGGPKDTPVLKSINAVGTEENAPTISNVRIIQVKDGWYWIKFREDGMDVDSYMVVQE